MQTLTLQLDDILVQHVQHYAQQQGKSLSQLVAEYLVRLDSEQTQQHQQFPPITQSLLGVLRGVSVDEQEYKTYLEEKYR